MITQGAMMAAGSAGGEVGFIGASFTDPALGDAGDTLYNRTRSEPTGAQDGDLLLWVAGGDNYLTYYNNYDQDAINWYGGGWIKRFEVEKFDYGGDSHLVFAGCATLIRSGLPDFATIGPYASNNGGDGILAFRGMNFSASDSSTGTDTLTATSGPGIAVCFSAIMDRGDNINFLNNAPSGFIPINQSYDLNYEFNITGSLITSYIEKSGGSITVTPPAKEAGASVQVNGLVLLEYA